MKIRFSDTKASGFTLVELILVVTIIGLLAGIGIPSLFRARDDARLSTIYSNLREIESAKSQWALENRKQTGDPVEDIAALSSYFRGGKISDVMRETYLPNAVGTPAQAELPAGAPLGNYHGGSSIEAP